MAGLVARIQRQAGNAVAARVARSFVVQRQPTEQEVALVDAYIAALDGDQQAGPSRAALGDYVRGNPERAAEVSSLLASRTEAWLSRARTAVDGLLAAYHELAYTSAVVAWAGQHGNPRLGRNANRLLAPGRTAFTNALTEARAAISRLGDLSTGMAGAAPQAHARFLTQTEQLFATVAHTPQYEVEADARLARLERHPDRAPGDQESRDLAEFATGENDGPDRVRHARAAIDRSRTARRERLSPGLRGLTADTDVDRTAFEALVAHSLATPPAPASREAMEGLVLAAQNRGMRDFRVTGIGSARPRMTTYRGHGPGAVDISGGTGTTVTVLLPPRLQSSAVGLVGDDFELHGATFGWVDRSGPAQDFATKAAAGYFGLGFRAGLLATLRAASARDPAYRRALADVPHEGPTRVYLRLRSGYYGALTGGSPERRPAPERFLTALAYRNTVAGSAASPPPPGTPTVETRRAELRDRLALAVDPGLQRRFPGLPSLRQALGTVDAGAPGDIAWSHALVPSARTSEVVTAIQNATATALSTDPGLGRAVEEFLSSATGSPGPLQPFSNRHADYRGPVPVDRPGGGEVSVDYQYERGTERIIVRVTFTHLSEVAAGVEAGANVAAGHPIGRTGTSGNAAGPHAHVQSGARLGARHLGPVSPITFFGVETTGADPTPPAGRPRSGR
ncbi:M23 family metallopeptidase [Actinosynnema sp. CA-248983]